ncbi:hypothetical protein AM501_16140 [Aneurinibacillus migulanus]|uniref:hypothetical protein n=1 Tax=Aneurinibacillus migulanus TaxID=47500 RepID=UPI0005B7A504|nr:hypothetical protein [Aneurinibacillus migulanus]KIV53273.1 hypothetical protein TS64_20040 [Aneurinibacillus migulanus]KPD07331.1 hypothetical protein AM501_16140 [Aneurinibacillus migulanus]
MQMDEKVKYQLKKEMKQIEVPKQLDAHITQLYERHMEAKRGLSRYGKPSRVAAIVVSCLLFSGVAYASNLLYSMHAPGFNLSVSKNEGPVIEREQADEIRSFLYSVKGQLATGETAIIYAAELEKRKLPVLIKVSNPSLYTNMDDWRKQLPKSLANINVPQSFPGGFALVGGRIGLSTEPISVQDYNSYAGELKKRADETGNKMVWEKAKPSHSQNQIGISTPNVMYTNQSGDNVYVSYETIPNDETSIKINTNHDTTSEKINGEDSVYYSRNINNFLSETGVFQEITWIEKGEEGNILYRIFTESPTVKKQDLLLMLNNLKKS